VALTARGFRGTPETSVTVRTSAGPMDGGQIRATGTDGGFVVVASGRGFPAPVIWCCDREDTQVVVESDGRRGAPEVVAAALDGTRVRMLARRATGGVLISADASESAPRRTEAGFPGRPGPRQAAMARGLVAWADTPAYGRGRVVRVGTPTDTGVRGVRSLAQPGPVLGLWAAPGVVVAATRVRGRVEVARHDLPRGVRRVLWRGPAVPPLAVGGGAVAVADGRRVLAGRGAALRPVRTARGVVAALATDGRRLAVFERGTVKNTRRRDARGRVLPPTRKVTVVRLVRIP
jgi:hypothetical protein